MAKKLGKELGGNGYSFSSSTYTTKGCYAYKSGTYENVMFYGTEGTQEERKSELVLPKYRPPGYDCKGNFQLISYSYLVNLYFYYVDHS